MRVTITGADGMLGSAVMSELADMELFPLVEPTFVLEDRDGVRRAIMETRPDWVVHTAAMTDVDGCEEKPALAYSINAMGTLNVALACAACDAGLFYISTDFVFGAREHRTPIEAWETPAPLSVYGTSKFGGERYAELIAPRSIIARTAWLYGHHGKHFVGTILNRARQGLPLRVVDDQCGSPTYANDVAIGIAALLSRGVPGWYHLVNRGAVSWFDFARAIVFKAGMDPECIDPCSTEDFQRPAPRPKYSVLSTFTYEQTTNRTMRVWDEALTEFIQGLGDVDPDEERLDTLS